MSIAIRLCLLLTLTASLAAAQSIVDLVPVKDNTLFEDPGGGLSNGAGTGIFTGFTANLELRRGLIQFDPTSSIPPGAIIVGATLRMNLEQSNGNSVSVALHPALTDWGEAGSVATFMGGGGGAPAQPGDATWLHTFFPGSFWASAGGDFAAASASTTVGSTLGAYTWSSPALTADVQSWLDTPASNFGWVLVTPETVVGLAVRLSSRESAVAAFRPALRVTYIPYPGSGDDLTLDAGINGPVGTDPIVTPTGGDSLSLTIASPGGAYVGLPPILVGQLFTTGFPPVPPSGFPEIHLDPALGAGVFLIFDGSVGPLGAIGIPAGGLSFLFPGLPLVPAGQSVMLQTIVFTSSSNNGIFAITQGVELRFQ